MDPLAQSTAELHVLRTLCDESAARERRLELAESLRNHVFLDSEHQVVFESICFLFPRGPISAERLAVHLNNRGFPDVDLGKYFPAASRASHAE